MTNTADESISQQELLEKFVTNAANKTSVELIVTKGLGHANQMDQIVLRPLDVYLSEYSRLPHRQYIDLYLLNAWLIILFLYRTEMFTNPERL